jgi:hypothetical protein
MSLPKLNGDFTFDLVLPSSRKTVRYRPYLVKEEKMLLMAYESQKPAEVMKAMRNIIDVCFEGVNASEMPLYDVEYCFINLRAKSAGEVTEVEYACQDCGTHNPVQIDLESVKASDPVENMVIELTDTVSLKMKYPTLSDCIKNPEAFGSVLQSKNLTIIIGTMIESVMTEDSIVKFANETAEDQEAFIGSLNHKQLQKIKDWIEASPKCTISFDFKCQSCGTHNEVDLVGVQNFFS